MFFRTMLMGLLATGVAIAEGDPVRAAVEQALAGLEASASAEPYSRTIQRIYLGLDKAGGPRIGVALRKIEAFESITAMVVVEKTPTGYVLREARFPDIGKIQNGKDRARVASILKKFKNVPFDPHAEKSAVDGLTSASGHFSKVGGYLNYLARSVALEMEAKGG